MSQLVFLFVVDLDDWTHLEDVLAKHRRDLGVNSAVFAFGVLCENRLQREPLATIGLGAVARLIAALPRSKSLARVAVALDLQRPAITARELRLVQSMLLKHQHMLVAIDWLLVEGIRLGDGCRVALALNFALVPDQVVDVSESALLEQHDEVGGQRDLAFAPTLDALHVVVVHDIAHVPHKRSVVVEDAIGLLNDCLHVVHVGLKRWPRRVVARIVVGRRGHHQPNTLTWHPSQCLQAIAPDDIDSLRIKRNWLCDRMLGLVLGLHDLDVRSREGLDIRR